MRRFASSLLPVLVLWLAIGTGLAQDAPQAEVMWQSHPAMRPPPKHDDQVIITGAIMGPMVTVIYEILSNHD